MTDTLIEKLDEEILPDTNDWNRGYNLGLHVAHRICNEHFTGNSGEISVLHEDTDLPPRGHPLQELGAKLADLLDDDQWNNIEPYLRKVWKECKKKRETGEENAVAVLKAFPLPASNKSSDYNYQRILSWLYSGLLSEHPASLIVKLNEIEGQNT